LQRERKPRDRNLGATSLEDGARHSLLAATMMIDGSLDSHALEALQLELKRLAQGCGLEVEVIEVRTVERPLRERRRGQDSFKPERHVKRTKNL
jgi:hypothetical protein